MKICPQCQKTYSDENLNFCLEDGSVLSQQTSSNTDLPQTVLISPPRDTNPQHSFGNQPNTQPTGFGGQQGFSMQPKPKSSKTWLWAVGILGLVVILCVGGFAGLVLLGAMVEDENPANNQTTVNNTPVNNDNLPADNRKDVTKIDFSRWQTGRNATGSREYANGQYLISNFNSRNYIVVLGGENHLTQNATAKTIIKNVDGKRSSLGYGLVVHSDEKHFEFDYALLIDTVRKTFRIVKHYLGDQSIEQNWKYSSAINGGTADNTLEVKDDNKDLEFFINGQSVAKIRDESTRSDGKIGFYVGDAIKIAILDAEIRK